MEEISRQQMHRIAGLFTGEDTLILSCLQGHMGRAWACGGCAQIITGDFCYLAGDSLAPEARTLAAHIPGDRTGAELLIIPPDDGWSRLIGEVHGERAALLERYAFHRPAPFDRAALQDMARRLPEGFAIKQIDAGLYAALMAEGWSRDLCAQFGGAEDYLRRGLGYAVIADGRPVCGASSYTIYDGGLEIEIDTRPEFRRRGLALACAARLITAALDRGIYPNWDAANPGSKALAGKLGYRFSHAYPAWRVKL